MGGGGNINNILSSDAIKKLPANVVDLIHQRALPWDAPCVYLVFFLGIANLIVSLFLPDTRRYWSNKSQSNSEQQTKSRQSWRLFRLLLFFNIELFSLIYHYFGFL